MKADVLLVDDNPQNLQVLASILKQHESYRVRAVLSGEMALQASVAQPPDLFVLDIDMPNMDGITLCREIKQLPELADIPVIFISALNEVEDKIRAFEAGGVDYITKPFQTEEVMARVSSQLNAYRYTQEIGKLAAFQERQRIARELHDSVNQTLFSTSIVAQTLLHEFDDSPTEAIREQVQRIYYMTQDALLEMRTLLLEIYPKRLQETPLDQLLGNLIRTLEARLDTPVTPALQAVDLPPEVKLVFYRVAQEAFSNAIKHADPTEINVLLRPWRHGAHLIVQDDGCGFELRALPGRGYGLGNMRSRADEIDAAFHIDTAPEEGTLISLKWSQPQ